MEHEAAGKARRLLEPQLGEAQEETLYREALTVYTF
jgi:hypothetical protein